MFLATSFLSLHVLGSDGSVLHRCPGLVTKCPTREVGCAGRCRAAGDESLRARARQLYQIRTSASARQPWTTTHTHHAKLTFAHWSSETSRYALTTTSFAQPHSLSTTCRNTNGDPYLSVSSPRRSAQHMQLDCGVGASTNGTVRFPRLTSLVVPSLGMRALVNFLFLLLGYLTLTYRSEWVKFDVDFTFAYPPHQLCC